MIPEFEEEIKAAFDLFDKDKSDNIDKHELRDAMRALGIRMTKKQIKARARNLGIRGKNFISRGLFDIVFKIKVEEESRICFAANIHI